MGLVGWALLGAVLVGVLAALEGFRQSRQLARRGERSRRRPGLIGLGALELQRHLQPERKVEVVMQEAKKEDRLNPDYRPGLPGDDLR